MAGVARVVVVVPPPPPPPPVPPPPVPPWAKAGVATLIRPATAAATTRILLLCMSRVPLSVGGRGRVPPPSCCPAIGVRSAIRPWSYDLRRCWSAGACASCSRLSHGRNTQRLDHAVRGPAYLG